MYRYVRINFAKPDTHIVSGNHHALVTTLVSRQAYRTLVFIYCVIFHTIKMKNSWVVSLLTDNSIIRTPLQYGRSPKFIQTLPPYLYKRRSAVPWSCSTVQNFSDVVEGRPLWGGFQCEDFSEWSGRTGNDGRWREMAVTGGSTGNRKL